MQRLIRSGIGISGQVLFLLFTFLSATSSISAR